MDLNPNLRNVLAAIFSFLLIVPYGIETVFIDTCYEKSKYF